MDKEEVTVDGVKGHWRYLEPGLRVFIPDSAEGEIPGHDRPVSSIVGEGSKNDQPK